jgi:hypothetical protein
VIHPVEEVSLETTIILMIGILVNEPPAPDAFHQLVEAVSVVVEVLGKEEALKPETSLFVGAGAPPEAVEVAEVEEAAESCLKL